MNLNSSNPLPRLSLRFRRLLHYPLLLALFSFFFSASANAQSGGPGDRFPYCGFNIEQTSVSFERAEQEFVSKQISRRLQDSNIAVSLEGSIINISSFPRNFVFTQKHRSEESRDNTVILEDLTGDLLDYSRSMLNVLAPVISPADSEQQGTFSWVFDDIYNSRSGYTSVGFGQRFGDCAVDGAYATLRFNAEGKLTNISMRPVYQVELDEFSREIYRTNPLDVESATDKAVDENAAYNYIQLRDWKLSKPTDSNLTLQLKDRILSPIWEFTFDAEPDAGSRDAEILVWIDALGHAPPKVRKSQLSLGQRAVANSISSPADDISSASAQSSNWGSKELIVTPFEHISRLGLNIPFSLKVECDDAECRLARFADKVSFRIVSPSAILDIDRPFQIAVRDFDTPYLHWKIGESFAEGSDLSAQKQRSAAEAFYWLSSYRDILSKWGICYPSIDRQSCVPISVQITESLKPVAEYNRPTITLSYLRRIDPSRLSATGDPQVVAHEIVHGLSDHAEITDRSINACSDRVGNPKGAFDESIADIMGTALAVRLLGYRRYLNDSMLSFGKHSDVQVFDDADIRDLSMDAGNNIGYIDSLCDYNNPLEMFTYTNSLFTTRPAIYMLQTMLDSTTSENEKDVVEKFTMQVWEIANERVKSECNLHHASPSDCETQCRFAKGVMDYIENDVLYLTGANRTLTEEAWKQAFEDMGCSTKLATNN